MSDAMKNMRTVFDYGNLTDEHKAAANAIMELMLEWRHDDLAEVIKNKFRLVENARAQVEDHEFFNACKKAGIVISIQGHVADLSQGGLEYPVITVSDDIRKFFQLYNIIKNHSDEDNSVSKP
jgi:hypothetical protein